MSLGTWEPGGPANIPDAALLATFVNLAEQDALETMAKELDSEVLSLGSMMKLPRKSWQPTFESLSDQELIALAKFFTRAEMLLDDWEAGKHSPVIWICKILKTRGKFPDQDLIAWFKENTDNRFIPFGSVL